MPTSRETCECCEWKAEKRIREKIRDLRNSHECLMQVYRERSLSTPTEFCVRMGNFNLCMSYVSLIDRWAVCCSISCGRETLMIFDGMDYRPGSWDSAFEAALDEEIRYIDDIAEGRESLWLDEEELLRIATEMFPSHSQEGV